jgi:diguanylate cyclase (GGDEF)-like protein/PAS domain S-box-containing protein
MIFMLKHLSVKAKIGAVIAVVLMAFGSGLGLLYQRMRANVLDDIDTQLQNTTTLITDMVETAADVSIRNYLRALADTNIEILTSLHQGQIHGNLTLDQAQDEARKILGGQPVAETGYIYCINSEGTVTMHPNPEVQGVDVSEAAFVRTQMQRKQGYLEYEWKNPQEEALRPKVMYMAYFEPWDWIVSVTSYKSEFSKLISVDDFRQRVESIRLGESGYAYIMAEDGEIIIHPFLGGNLLESQNEEGIKLAQALLNKEQGRLNYLWKNPKDNTPREKIVFFNTIPEYGWVVGSSGYLDEFYTPVHRLRDLILASLGLALLFSLPLVLFISRSITLPLAQLTAALAAWNAPEGEKIRVQWDSNDEIGVLARHFNQFMDRIETAANDLSDEVQERKQAQKELQIYQKIYQNAIEGISLTTPDGHIVAANPAFTQITGYTEEEVLGQTPSILKSGQHSSLFYEQMWQSLQQAGAWAGEVWNKRKNGEVYPEWLSISSIRDEHGDVIYYAAVFHDISEMKMQEDQIRFLAYHDPLTSLPNRTLLMDRLEVALSHARRQRSRLAILFIDIDNFKNINDSMGHALGDTMLLEFVRRVRDVVRETDTLARLGGDEFVIMAEELTGENAVIQLAERVMRCLETPFRLEGREFYATASMGITLYPEDGETAGELIKNADLAMYWAKDTGKNRYHLYTEEMNTRVTHRLQLEADLRQALEQDEITVYFQPRVSLTKGRATGVEALARWIRPGGSVVPPSEFIPVAEDTGLIIPLGLTILEKALQQILELHSMGRPLYLSVNLSPKQFQQVDLLDHVDEILQRTNFPAKYLEFEITETVIMQHLDTSLSNLHRLSRRGIRLAIDDFGTGYSSLYYLKRLPIDVLKVDRSFVQDLEEDPNDAKLVETIILLGKSFGLSLVAEGVETSGQLHFLKNLNCDEVQGYFFSNPLPFSSLLKYIGNEPK